MRVGYHLSMTRACRNVHHGENLRRRNELDNALRGALKISWTNMCLLIIIRDDCFVDLAQAKKNIGDCSSCRNLYRN